MSIAPQTSTRRALMKGAAWSVPAVAVSSAAPAFAVSMCTAESMKAIDDAFANLLTKQGSLTINFYQSIQSANGYLGESWLNLRNDSDVPLRFTAEHPLTLRVEVVNLTGSMSKERASTWPSTSWGTIARGDFNTSTGTRTYTWTIVGTVAAYGKGDNEPDFWFHWQGLGSITNEVRVTPLTSNSPLPPTLESITLASGQTEPCQSYYDTKVREYNESAAKKVVFYADGSKNSGNSDRYGDQSVALGQKVRSSVIGDFRPAGAGDGIY